MTGGRRSLMMTRTIAYSAVLLLCVPASFPLAENTTDATEIVRRADEKMRGRTSRTELTMRVVRPDWTRTVSMKAWSRGRDYSMILITAPAKERGQVFLKRKTEMWNWLPSISRMIKIPPSMMSQSWMGSDYTNDDLLKESSVVVDYTHAVTGGDTVDGYACHRVELTPKPDAAVVWGKVVMWISRDEHYQLRIEHYDEDGEPVSTETLSAVRKIGNRTIPTHMEILPAGKPGRKTVLDITSAVYDEPVREAFFSQQNMKRVR
jgi:outer membrane lipoprotein-sorting protein